MVSRKIVVWSVEAWTVPSSFLPKGMWKEHGEGFPALIWSKRNQWDSLWFLPSFRQGNFVNVDFLRLWPWQALKQKKKKKKGGSSNVVFFKEPIPVLWNARESWRTWASPSGNEPSFLSGYRKMWYQETSLRQYLANVAEWCGGIGWEWKVCFPLLTDSWLAALTPPSLFLLLLFDEEAGL